MNVLDIVTKLARKAQKESVPYFDVSDKVLWKIRLQQEETLNFVFFDVFAGVSALAALIMALLSVAAWHYMANPIVAYLAPLQEVPLW